MEVSSQLHAPAGPLYLRGRKPQYSLDRRLGGPKRIILALPGVELSYCGSFPVM